MVKAVGQHQPLVKIGLRLLAAGGDLPVKVAEIAEERRGRFLIVCQRRAGGKDDPQSRQQGQRKYKHPDPSLHVFLL